MEDVNTTKPQIFKFLTLCSIVSHGSLHRPSGVELAHPSKFLCRQYKVTLTIFVSQCFIVVIMNGVLY